MGSAIEVSSLGSPQTKFLQETKELREKKKQTHSQNTTIYSADKPPIPPRGLPPPVPQRQISSIGNVQLRNRSGNQHHLTEKLSERSI